MTTTLNASNSGSGGLVATADASGVLALQTAGTTAVTVDTSQNVGIGTTTIGQKLVIESNSSQLRLRNSTTRYRSDYTVDSSGNMEINSYDDTGSAYKQIKLNGIPLIFSVGSEAMRIDSSGNVLVGTTSTSVTSGGYNFLINDGGTGYSTGYIGHITGCPSGYAYLNFKYAGTAIGTITQNGTTGVLYNLTSDYRLKNNAVTLTGAKDFVMALQPKTWDWWDGSGKGVGFIAHEFMEVAKYSGSGEKDAVDADNKPIHQAIQPSSSEVMANLVAFVQEQQALITSLTARFAALEGTPA